MLVDRLLPLVFRASCVYYVGGESEKSLAVAAVERLYRACLFDPTHSINILDL